MPCGKMGVTMPMTTDTIARLTDPQSRRLALQTGGVLAAALSLFGSRSASAQDATPHAEASNANALLVQSFNSGTLFPTQGDAGGPPYTLYLWEVAERGTFFVDPANHVAGVIATEPVLAAIMSVNEEPRAVLAAMVKQDDNEEPHQEVWALKLALAQDGSDPGSLTYQGDLLSNEDANAWLGLAEMSRVEGALNLGPGFFILPAPAGFDATSAGGLQLHLG
jgi:hypothetical protein